MPTYDLACGHEAVLNWTPNPECVCPECGAETKRLPVACRTAGIVWSNPIVFDKKAGDRGMFKSPSELRAWEAKNPDKEIVSTSGSEWRAHKDDAANGANDAAKGLGYIDRDHMKARQAEAKKKAAANNKPPPTMQPNR
jgi:hypothetical protein